MGHIYKITNKVNGKSYVGQTRKSISERIKEHVRNSLYSKDTASDTHLYMAIRKHGEENFSIEEIESCQDDLLNERETFWIAYFDTYNSGYNETIGGGGRTKYPLSEVYERWREGYTMAEMHDRFGYDYSVFTRLYEIEGVKEEAAQRRTSAIKRAHEIAIRQYSLSGDFIAEYPSLAEAKKAIGKENCSKLSACINGKAKSAHGYQWRKATDPAPKQYCRGGARAVEMVNGMGNVVKTFPSARAAAKFVGTFHNEISKLCKNNALAYGYLWRFAPEEALS